MNILDLQKLQLNPKVMADLDVPLADVISSEHFHRKQPKGVDYRQEAIQHLVELKEPFSSNCNLGYELVRKFVQVACPYCSAPMSVTGGGGSSSQFTVTYSCAGCSAQVGLAFPRDGFWVGPPLYDCHASQDGKPAGAQYRLTRRAAEQWKAAQPSGLSVCILPAGTEP